MLNQAQVLLKRSCTFGKLGNIQITGITLLCTGKNNICISCVFNGFKYISLCVAKTLLTVAMEIRVVKTHKRCGY